MAAPEARRPSWLAGLYANGSASANGPRATTFASYQPAGARHVRRRRRRVDDAARLRPGVADDVDLARWRRRAARGRRRAPGRSRRTSSSRRRPRGVHLEVVDEAGRVVVGGGEHPGAGCHDDVVVGWRPAPRGRRRFAWGPRAATCRRTRTRSTGRARRSPPRRARAWRCRTPSCLRRAAAPETQRRRARARRRATRR